MASAVTARPRVPPKGSRGDLRPRGELASLGPIRRSVVEVQVAEVSAKEKEAGNLVRRNELRQALALYSECQEDIKDALEGLGKDDLHYLTLVETSKGVAEKIKKVKEFLPYEYFIQPVGRR
ncbi:unnamed protein product [Polarella glacialis]|uniref:Uncharacterized protein n=1 Tax=Polarella glacialis TaxID=89957 RepID=A0A813JS78_POLGL|nr:unnamed protein product [Polarella glacialis]